jgi:hypothetical protein
MQGNKALLPILQYTISQLVVVLSMGETKIRNLIDEGELISYRVGGTIFVSVADANAFIEMHRERAMRASNPGLFQVTENN